MIRAHISEMTIEEVANTLTHGLGLVLSVAGFGVLLTLAILYGDAWHIASSVVYGTSLVVLYAASTFYHAAVLPHRKRFLQLLDHCCIYLLIAGTYTPFVLTAIRSSTSSALLIVIWAVAIAGIALKILFRDKLKGVGIFLYMLMGWASVFGLKELYAALGLTALLLVIAGGVAYSLGMIFFGWHRIKHHHAIFHVFVLAGSILHYIVIVGWIVMRPA